MTLADDINALPAKVGDGHTRHLNDHQVIHTALKDHQSRLSGVEGRIPDTLKLSLDTGVGTRITSGSALIYGDTGWRSITDLLTPAPNSGGLRVRRTEDAVHLHFSSLTFNSGVASTGKIPRTWWTGASVTVPITDNSGSRCGSLTVTYSGDMTIRWVSTTAGTCMAVLPTTEAWPSELIGS